MRRTVKIESVMVTMQDLAPFEELERMRTEFLAIGIPSASRGVAAGRLAVPRRARARARDGTPNRGHPSTQVVGH